MVDKGEDVDCALLVGSAGTFLDRVLALSVVCSGAGQSVALNLPCVIGVYDRSHDVGQTTLLDTEGKRAVAGASNVADAAYCSSCESDCVDNTLLECCPDASQVGVLIREERLARGLDDEVINLQRVELVEHRILQHVEQHTVLDRDDSWSCGSDDLGEVEADGVGNE